MKVSDLSLMYHQKSDHAINSNGQLHAGVHDENASNVRVDLQFAQNVDQAQYVGQQIQASKHAPGGFQLVICRSHNLKLQLLRLRILQQDVKVGAIAVTAFSKLM